MIPKQNRIGIEEYLIREKTLKDRYELIDGEMVMMSGGTRNHNRLVQRVSEILSREGCETFRENIKVLTNFDSDACYPDVLLVCGEIEGPDNFVNNPLIIVEVLSNSTRDYDMGSKFRKYQRVSSLKHYILVEQYGIYVEHSERTSDMGWYTYPPYCTLDDSFKVEGMKISLLDIYQVVRWDEQ